MTEVMKQLWQYVLVALAIMVIVLGLVLFLLPIPLGFAVLVIGVAWLLTVSVTARLWFLRQRKRYKLLHDSIAKVEPHLPEGLRKVLNEDGAA
jgi:heme A synthase